MSARVGTLSTVAGAARTHPCCGRRLSASDVHGILQARILEGVAFPFSRDLPNPGIKPRSPALHGRLWQFAHPRPLSLLQRGLAPRSKGKARAVWRGQICMSVLVVCLCGNQPISQPEEELRKDASCEPHVKTVHPTLACGCPSVKADLSV